MRNRVVLSCIGSTSIPTWEAPRLPLVSHFSTIQAAPRDNSPSCRKCPSFSTYGCMRVIVVLSLSMLSKLVHRACAECSEGSLRYPACFLGGSRAALSDCRCPNSGIQDETWRLLPVPRLSGIVRLAFNLWIASGNSPSDDVGLPKATLVRLGTFDNCEVVGCHVNDLRTGLGI